MSQWGEGWERVGSEFSEVERFRVPHGWIYQRGSAMAYVPDHEDCDCSECRE